MLVRLEGSDSVDILVLALSDLRLRCPLGPVSRQKSGPTPCNCLPCKVALRLWTVRKWAELRLG